MLQDILPHRLDIAFHPVPPSSNSRALVFDGDRLLAAEREGGLTLPLLADCRPPAPALCGKTGSGADSAQGEGIEAGPIFLFELDGEPFFLLPAGTSAEGFSLLSVSVLRRAGAAKETAFAALTGYQLYKWYRDNRFCGRCGAPLAREPAERALCCPGCGKIVYPRINPVVIVAVTSGDRLLMTRYAGGSYRSWALVAGFVEVGETPEDAARREVLEETGVRIKNLRYAAAQPWAFSDSLLLGFFAELDGPDAITLQQSELSEAAWVPRAEIRHQPEDFSLTGELIDRFVRGEEPR